MSDRSLASARALVVLLIGACAAEPDEVSSDTGSAAGTTDGSGATSSTGATTSGDTDGPSAYEEDDGGTGCTFTCPDPPPPPPSATGGGGQFECQLFDQDCDDEKCAPWANDGSWVWNVTRCSPIARETSSVGGPCTVEGGPTGGIDSCQLGSMCWDVDPTTREGTCVAHCGGSPLHPLCDDPDDRCVVENDGAIVLCLPACHPGSDTCAEGTQCLPSARSGWVCVPSIGTPAGDTEPCEYLNACEPGFVCTNAAAVPNCTGSWGCCTRACVVGSTVPCPDPSWECVPWYAPGHAPPGLDDTGYCAAPPVPAAGWRLPKADIIAG